ARFGARFFNQFDGQAPILGLLAVCGLYSLAPFREVEQHFLAWLHSTRHLRGDLRALTHHLQECLQQPTPVERRRNIEMLEAGTALRVRERTPGRSILDHVRPE